ncbi:MAG TPA: hypothetical protein VF275_07555 [Gammaproteobacteria bacterium]
MDNREEKAAIDPRSIHSRIVTLTVEQGEDGAPRLVLEGDYMSATGFTPGDRVEAIVQPELISILNPE